MAPPPTIESVLGLGFRFEPTPRQAVSYYLPRLIAGEPMHAAIRPFIHFADVYACEPGALAAQFLPTPNTGDRFFFTTCKLQQQKTGKSLRAERTAGPGTWHSQGNSAGGVFDDAGVKIGEIKKLRYRKKSGEYTDWLMDEFSCCCQGSVVDDRQYVLCKIYVSPKAGPDSAARRESDVAVFAPPAEEPATTHKRPAAPPVAEPPRPKRIRGALVPIPTPPVVQSPPFPHRDMAPSPSATYAPASTPALEIGTIQPVVVVRARHKAVQAPAPHRHPPHHSPSIQTSTMAQEACPPVAARDPFAAAVQDDDGGCFDFAKPHEGTLTCDPFCTEAPTAAQEDDSSDDDENFANLLEDSLDTVEAEE